MSGRYIGSGAVIVALQIDLEGPEAFKKELEWQKKNTEGSAPAGNSTEAVSRTRD